MTAADLTQGVNITRYTEGMLRKEGLRAGRDRRFHFLHIDIEKARLDIHVDWMGASVEDGVRHHHTGKGGDDDFITLTNIHGLKNGIERHPAGAKANAMSCATTLCELLFIVA
jgi:hypothetical protein